MRWTKAGRTRTYHVRELEGGPELWVTSEDGRHAKKSRKLATFTNLDDVAPFLETVEQDLRAGGWIEGNSDGQLQTARSRMKST
jgi:hypothetical protein